MATLTCLLDLVHTYMYIKNLLLFVPTSLMLVWLSHLTIVKTNFPLNVHVHTSSVLYHCCVLCKVNLGDSETNGYVVKQLILA